MKRKCMLVLAIGLIFFAQAARADWTANKRLTWTASYTYHPAIVIDPSYYLHVVCDDYTPGNWEIYYKKSTNSGTDWTTKRLTWSSTGSAYPAIAIDESQNIQVVYEDHQPGPWQIYHKRSTNGGGAWSAAKRLTWTTGQALLPALAVDSSGVLHMVWQDDVSGNSEIYYKQSNDEGETWTVSKRLTWNSGASSSPALAVDSSDNLHLVWSDGSSGSVEICYRKSADGGTTWTATKRITWMSSIELRPKIAVDASDNPHVVWENPLPGNGDIYYKMSADGGTTWGANQRLTWTAGTAHEPSIGIALSGKIWVVWKDTAPGNSELFYRNSTDGGANWSLGQRITQTAGDSRDQAFAINSVGELNLVWSDDTPGNYELYFKKGN